MIIAGKLKLKLFTLLHNSGTVITIIVK